MGHAVAMGGLNLGKVGGAFFSAGMGAGTSYMQGGDPWVGAGSALMSYLLNQLQQDNRGSNSGSLAKKIVPQGYIKLNGLTDEQLKDIRIIPEESNDPMITPSKNGLYHGDGFYFVGGDNHKYWYKVSNGGGVYVTTVATKEGYNLITQPINNRIWQSLANLFHTDYFVGWRPVSQPHSSSNPFAKQP